MGRSVCGFSAPNVAITAPRDVSGITRQPYLPRRRRTKNSTNRAAAFLMRSMRATTGTNRSKPDTHGIIKKAADFLREEAAAS